MESTLCAAGRSLEFRCYAPELRRAKMSAVMPEVSFHGSRRMGKIVVITNLTLDGVMQAPGHSDEDPRGGFERGGWAAPFAAMQQPEAGAAFANMGALLFGRLTYERFYAFWPN